MATKLKKPKPRPKVLRAFARQPESGIQLQFELHDRHQVEVRCAYKLEGHDRHVFDVDNFLFVPRNIGLTSKNYQKQDFYADVNALMRLDAPSLPLLQLADAEQESSPLYPLARALNDFRSGRAAPPTRLLAVHVKLYAFAQTEAARRSLKHLRSLLGEVSGPEAKETFLALVDETLYEIRSTLAAFRRIRGAFAPYETLCHESLVEAFRLSDEHMSLFLEERLGVFSASFEADRSWFDGTGFVARVDLSLRRLAREEARYRTQQDFAVLRTELDRGEYFGYRMGFLKKAVHQALFLDVREAKGDTFVRNAIGAVGAALAAIWAFATQLPVTVAELPTNTKLAFFFFGVLAYVGKDRIKAFTNEYLTARLRSYDHVARIYGATLAQIGLGRVEALLKERMRFISVADVEERIRRLRTRSRTVRVSIEAAQEEVIHYQKRLVVAPEDERPLPAGYGVRDILRLNVRNFLVRLDDPEDKVRYFDTSRDAFGEADVPKVYHLNWLVRARRLGPDDRVLEERYQHLRVVLDKRGVARLEEVSSE